MIDPSSVLPHGPEALLITSVISVEGPRIECVAVVPASSPFARGRVAGAWLAAEIGAQAAGLHHGLARSASGAPRRIEGVLARVRDLVLHSPQLPVDTPLTVVARLLSEAMGFGAWAISLDAGSRPIATGTITTHVRSAS